LKVFFKTIAKRKTKGMSREHRASQNFTELHRASQSFTKLHRASGFDGPMGRQALGYFGSLGF
jgi:hypothetical protein